MKVWIVLRGGRFTGGAIESIGATKLCAIRLALAYIDRSKRMGDRYISQPQSLLDGVAVEDIWWCGNDYVCIQEHEVHREER